MSGHEPLTEGSSVAVVVDFLHALTRSDLDGALALVSDDLAYTNVSLPTVHGRTRLERLARPLLRPGRMGFDVRVHHVATDGDAVLTDRTDELRFGKFAARFWVYGRFIVRDGHITVWRDSFDWLDVSIGMLRGLLGLLTPALNRALPAGQVADHGPARPRHRGPRAGPAT
jgi:limonene-1,2-epoxide hydrolase